MTSYASGHIIHKCVGIGDYSIIVIIIIIIIIIIILSCLDIRHFLLFIYVLKKVFGRTLFLDMLEKNYLKISCYMHIFSILKKNPFTEVTTFFSQLNRFFAKFSPPPDLRPVDFFGPRVGGSKHG